MEWRAARGELGSKPSDKAAEAAAGPSDAASAAVAKNNTSTLPSVPSLHSHKLDDISMAESVLEGIASAAAASGKLESSDSAAAGDAVAETPQQAGAPLGKLQAPAAPRKLLAGRAPAEDREKDRLSKSMQERLQISGDSERAARAKETFGVAVQQEFKRLMAAGGVTANEAANLALKHAVAQQHAQA